MEQEIKRDGAAEDFGQIAGGDGELAEEPVGPARPAGVEIAAALGEVFSRHDPQAGREEPDRARDRVPQ